MILHCRKLNSILACVHLQKWTLMSPPPKTHTHRHTQHDAGRHHRSTGHHHHHHGTSSSSSSHRHGHHSSSGSSHHHSSHHSRNRPSSAGGASSSSSGGGSSSRPKGPSRPPGDELYVGKYKLLKTIGKGNFAKVKLARHMPTGQEVGDHLT